MLKGLVLILLVQHLSVPLCSCQSHVRVKSPKKCVFITFQRTWSAFGNTLYSAFILLFASFFSFLHKKEVKKIFKMQILIFQPANAGWYKFTALYEYSISCSARGWKLPGYDNRLKADAFPPLFSAVQE